jgi:predicted enzyme related to lactoylglutathione lyase
MIKGLGTVIYHVADLNRAKAWYTAVFQQEPYFDQPFYVGFNIAGYELGLNPSQTVTKSGRGGAVAYWRVDEIDSAVQKFLATGSTIVEPIQDVGDGIKVATVTDPFDNLIGLIENPHFELPKA